MDSKKMLPNGDISLFCGQLAMILRSGVSVQEGMYILCEDYDQELFAGIRDSLEEGNSLYTALLQTGAFPHYLLEMVRMGEIAGRLDDVMESLSIYYERNEQISDSVRGAVTYPLVMIIMMLAVILLLIVKVLPIFAQVFQQLGSELSGFALVMMNFGAAVSQYSAVIIGVIAALVVILLVMRRTKGGRTFFARLFSGGKLGRKIAAGRFAFAMSMTLSSGLDVNESLEMAQRLVDDEATRAKIETCRGKMEDGASFSEALLSVQMFPAIYARMISVGFKTGSVDAVMDKIALRYEQEIDAQISGIISILEPTLVAVLSVIVGMILLSVMMPIMGVLSAIA